MLMTWWSLLCDVWCHLTGHLDPMLSWDDQGLLCVRCQGCLRRSEGIPTGGGKLVFTTLSKAVQQPRIALVITADAPMIAQLPMVEHQLHHLVFHATPNTLN